MYQSTVPYLVAEKFFEVALIKFTSGYLLFVGRTRRINAIFDPDFCGASVVGEDISPIRIFR